MLVFCLLFVFLLVGRAEWGGDPVCRWLGLYFCFACCLDEAAFRGCFWWAGHTGSCIQVVSFVWILTIWYSLGFVLCSLGSWSPYSHLKAQRLISGQEQRFYKSFVMALSEIRTNIYKWETKHEPQTNGSYKIRQIIIKIMEYTHVHIHPWTKSKQSNKYKVELIDLVDKGNKKLYLPVTNKTN